jgi:hypothetical protein
MLGTLPPATAITSSCYIIGNSKHLHKTPQKEKPKNDKNNLPFFEVVNPTRENKPIAFSRSKLIRLTVNQMKLKV